MAQQSLLNNRYRLIEEEGSGGMAIVYKAQDLELDRFVAVKVLKPDLTKDPEFLMRFREEARAAANLSHPNIVTVHDFGQDGRTHYIVFEYIEGQDLKDFVQLQAPFDIESTLLIMIELCKGLGYAHRAGFVHCDVKPQNVLVTNERTVKLTDFGLARALTASYPTEAQEVVWGSPSYLSPERITGEPPTPASDVYSLGVVLFELLGGRLPFRGDTYRELANAHLNEQPPDLGTLNPLVPVELDAIVQKVLSKEPSQRYRTADQLGRILLKYRQQGEEVTAAFQVNPSQPTRVSQRPVAESEPEPDPVMPPLDMSRYGRGDTNQHATTGTPTAAHVSPGVRDVDVAEHDDSLGIDLCAVVLGLLALGAVLGLIPLWLSVFNTFAR
jgi:serine/threonine-protein kinase